MIKKHTASFDCSINIYIQKQQNLDSHEYKKKVLRTSALFTY